MRHSGKDRAPLLGPRFLSLFDIVSDYPISVLSQSSAPPARAPARVENSRPPAEFRTRIRPNSRIRRIRSISAEFGVTFRYITSSRASSLRVASRLPRSRARRRRPRRLRPPCRAPTRPSHQRSADYPIHAKLAHAPLDLHRVAHQSTITSSSSSSVVGYSSL